jgi:hypothetical protein
MIRLLARLLCLFGLHRYADASGGYRSWEADCARCGRARP